MKASTAVLLALSLVLFACSDDEKATSNNGAVPDQGVMDMGVDPAPIDLGPADTGQDAAPDLPPDLGDEFDMAPDMEPDMPLTIAERCFSDIVGTGFAAPDYDQYNPRIGEHCLGTNHQYIYGIEEVVFLGDSVTVGTPPSGSNDVYRARLSVLLANQFNLASADLTWKSANPSTGQAGKEASGSFRSCSEWGARTDDFLNGGDQINSCWPTGSSDKRTLVVMTMGGNDVSAFTKAGAEGMTPAEVRVMAEQAIQYLEEAINWLTDPTRFPNGVYVVFASPYEFTDATGDTESCPSSSLTFLPSELTDLVSEEVISLLGYTEWDDPNELGAILQWFNEQYMRIAVETGTDLIFMAEKFCGHGFKATDPDADPNATCYLGPGTPLWFDLTCIHPNVPGHNAIAQMFLAVINEAGRAP